MRLWTIQTKTRTAKFFHPVVGGSAKKVGLRIKELERLYGIQNGSIHFQGNQHKEVVTNKSEVPTFTQEQLASRMGMSVDTLQNYKLLVSDSKQGVYQSHHSSAKLSSN